MTALGAEVVWTRLLSLLLGATVYTFSIILAVFLVGLWAGSSAGSFLARRVRDPRLALAACQILLAVAIAWTAWTLAYVLPYWPVDPWLSTSPWFNFDLDVARCVRAIFPATLLWGASFPLALAARSRGWRGSRAALRRGLRGQYRGLHRGRAGVQPAADPAIGTQGSQQLLIWLAAAGAAGRCARRRFEVAPCAWSAAALAGAVVLAWLLCIDRFRRSLAGDRLRPARRAHPARRCAARTMRKPATPLFVGEGINSSVVITQNAATSDFSMSAAKSEASSAMLDMRLQRMMGHLPALVHRCAAVPCWWSDSARESRPDLSFPTPRCESIVICELEPI